MHGAYWVTRKWRPPAGMILDQDKQFYFFLQTIYKAWKLNYNRSLEVVKLSWKLKLMCFLSVSVKYKKKESSIQYHYHGLFLVSIYLLLLKGPRFLFEVNKTEFPTDYLRMSCLLRFCRSCCKNNINVEDSGQHK